MKPLMVLAPLLLCCSVVLPLPPPGRIVNCDDAEAHEAANAAIQHINDRHNTGYKFTLNRVEKVKVRPTASGEMIFLELDLLETKCPSISPTPLLHCVVRPVTEQAVEGDCDVKLHKENGTYNMIGTWCKSELDSAENMRKVCPDCPNLAPLNDTQVVHAVDVSLHKINVGNVGNNSTFYLLHEIGRGRIQSGISNSVHVEFVIAASNCTIDEANSGTAACVEKTGAGAHFAACSGSVVKHPGAVDEEVEAQCTVYKNLVGEVVETGAPQVPLAPPKTNVLHFHHNLHHPSMGPHSSESNSAEHYHAAKAGHVFKRSPTGNPVPPSVQSLPLCPGKKIHF
ncbi:alpha-2-HS-glycoprotein [Anomaloglossus baeobatrachus]|uniref:alpha-2-HS-glycoprotein n=1 Tax=Anomaloglossus baeobatrachus TaxID=238106 RepID=UPI003F4FA8D3